MSGIEEQAMDEPIIELTVTVWRVEGGLLSCITRMGAHEVHRVEGVELRDLLVAAGKNLPRVT